MISLSNVVKLNDDEIKEQLKNIESVQYFLETQEAFLFSRYFTLKVRAFNPS